MGCCGSSTTLNSISGTGTGIIPGGGLGNPNGNPPPNFPIIWGGTWNTDTNYPPNVLVQYNGSTYISTSNTLGDIPSTLVNWALVASIGAPGATGSVGATGNTGLQGVSQGIHYKFSNNTASSDPGSGTIGRTPATKG